MDFYIATDLQEHLALDEKLLWTGQPKKGIVFRPADIVLVPFSLLWCGFAIFWEIAAITMGAPFFFILFGVPFVVIGLIMVFGRFFIDAKQRENTIYGLTDERIIIKSGVFKKTVRSIDISTLSDIQYEEKSDGSGTIYIGPKNPKMVWGNGMTWWSDEKTIPSLNLIEDVKEVYSKIADLQKKK